MNRSFTLLCTMITCGLIGFFLITTSFSFSEADMRAWYRLLNNQPKKKKKTFVKQGRVSKQKRLLVTKWGTISDPWNQKQFWLSAKESDFISTWYKNKVSIVEEMKHVRAIMQQDLFYKTPNGKELYRITNNRFIDKATNQECVIQDPSILIPMQRFRCFEAESANFDVRKRLLYAHNAIFWTYEIQGHGLNFKIDHLTPIMKGKAKDLKFSFASSMYQESFSADQVQLNLKNGKNIW